ncbi:DNA helicase RecQ [Thiomicrospira sp. WB1]|uniref:DNA helicase RecQ n=1 Tax=Thiomicrospira sp. WB1 TaxID=1685380 RepID=UPI00074A3E6E|nr:DNA helicase RecQ [Thiomicrospira sp. WB1]KUJ71689.1 ATP-dependent DNA helicase RecQ [Thiomicrospira sp. WB1]
MADSAQDSSHDTARLQAQTVLKSVFGFEDFRPGQEAVITHLLGGGDVMVLMPTGGGKSLCYQIPALIRPGTAIVVSPLISLMQDQVGALKALGIRAEFYNSSLDPMAGEQVLRQLHEGELDLLYVSPERLLMPGFIAQLQSLPIAMLAIDEAHCVSQWGHDFRPEYSQIGALRPLLPEVPFLALTATADQATRDDMLARLQLQRPHIEIGCFDRPNIRYTVQEKRTPAKQLQAFLDTRDDDDSGIVYCLSRKRVEEVAAQLQDQGYLAKAYHAGLPADHRARVHQDFLRDEVRIVVATVAFGMGIDKPNVRFVVHYDLPKNIEGYYQETGRAGRDGLSAEALLLFGGRDISTARYFIEQNTNEEQRRIESFKLSAMVEFAQGLSCRRMVLLNYFGQRDAKPCGNCDVCLNPPRVFDGLEAAQKVLSCVYRLGQGYGVRYVIEILRGQENERIRNLNHQTLSTWGIGKEYSAAEWESIIHQLIHQGFLVQDIRNYSVLQFTEKSGALLKGQVSIELALPKKTKGRGGTRRSEKDDLSVRQREVFDALRALRKEIADSEDRPAYQVFGDAALIEMAKHLPQNDGDLLAIPGVGERKLARYGFEFLQCLRTF